MPAEYIAIVLGLMGAMVLVVHAVEIAEKRGKKPGRGLAFYVIAVCVWAAIDYLFILPQLRAHSPAYAENGKDYSLLYGRGIFQRDNVVMVCNLSQDVPLWAVARAYDVQSGRYLKVIDPTVGDECRANTDKQGRNYEWYQTGTIEPYDPTSLGDAWDLSTVKWGERAYH